MAVCPQCLTPTTNPRFCSIRCSAIFNNKLRTKQPPHLCENGCGTTTDPRSKFCRKCAIETSSIDTSITIGEWRKRRKHQWHSRIRDHARAVYAKSDRPKHCVVCGYSRKFDVCHIKGITTFPLDTPILVVNAITNLIAMCKNHHDEFDDGVLVLPQGFEPCPTL